MATRVKQRAALRAENRDTRPVAHARHIRMSPYKVRAVLDVIREKSVNEALAILMHTPRIASEPVAKVLKSAIANAEHNNGFSRGDLVIAEIYAHQGPTIKRMQPVSKGRGHRILKRTSHITVILDEIQDKEVKPTKKTAVAKTDSKPKAKTATSKATVGKATPKEAKPKSAAKATDKSKTTAKPAAKTASKPTAKPTAKKEKK